MISRFYIFCIFLMPAYSLAASFDCNQELSGVETMICSDQNASNLDHELSKKYELEMRFASEEGKLRIKTDQRKWLRETRDSCLNVECLSDAYKIRIYHLDKYGNKSINHNLSYRGQYYDIKEFYRADERVSSFNKSGENTSDNRISDCEILIDIPVGTANGNHSYGGYCSLTENGDGEPQRVLVCDDEMVGHFKMESAIKSPAINQLAIFVVDNCYGG